MYKMETIEIPLILYKELIEEHLFHQMPNDNQKQRQELVEEYVELTKERYWEENV